MKYIGTLSLSTVLVALAFSLPLTAQADEVDLHGDWNCDGDRDVIDVQLGIFAALNLPISTALDADQDGVPDACPGTLRIYLSINGDDGNSGTDLDKPIHTLERAEEIIGALSSPRDVEVRIGPGRYHGQHVVWTTTFPNHSITFLPTHDDKNRPVFDGCPADETGTSCGGTFFKLSKEIGEASNLTFRYIRVEHYVCAMSLEGDRENVSNTWNGYNTVFGCYFYNIGDLYSNAGTGYAVIRLLNSDHNLIQNNHFVNNKNGSGTAGLLHGLYIAHHSGNNVIQSNSFRYHTGDPIRLRDASNYNDILNNKFTQTGVYGYSEWYCDVTASNCTKVTPECPSWENEFKYNTLNGNKDCDALNVWKLYVNDDAPPQCPNSAPFSGAKRLYTVGNTKTVPPCSTL